MAVIGVRLVAAYYRRWCRVVNSELAYNQRLNA